MKYALVVIASLFVTSSAFADSSWYILNVNNGDCATVKDAFQINGIETPYDYASAIVSMGGDIENVTPATWAEAIIYRVKLDSGTSSRYMMFFNGRQICIKAGEALKN